MPSYAYATRLQVTPVERDATLHAVREVLAAGVERLRMAVAFGSFVRNVPAADIDVAVELDPDWSFRDPGRIGALLRSTVGGPLDFDVIPIGSASPSLRYRIAVEGIPLYERTKGAWSLFYRNAVVEWSDIALSLARTGHAVGPFPEAGV
jgi:predicted nucleotidyltransferase